MSSLKYSLAVKGFVCKECNFFFFTSILQEVNAENIQKVSSLILFLSALALQRFGSRSPVRR